MLFFPKNYQKSVHDINYQKLSDVGVKCLVFDLDNTLLTMDKERADLKTAKLFKDLKKNFIIYIVSNNTKKSRVSRFAKSVECNYFYFSMKPFLKAIHKIVRKEQIVPKEICVIGDQIITDILMANCCGANSCLVDPLTKKDLKITSLNRFLEQKIIKYYQKKGVFKKGEYYE